MAAFQWVFDKAASISMIERNLTGQTITRNNTVRAVSRGNATMKFSVTMPAGMVWSQVADELALVDAAGMHTVESIALSNTGYSWIKEGAFTAAGPWDVICVQIPEWTISDINLVTWSGPFVFYESIV